MQVQRHLAAICASIFVVVIMGSANAQQVPTYAYHSYEKYKTAAHFRAFVITSIWKRFGVSTYRYRSSSIDAAIAGALDNCQRIVVEGAYAATSFDCKLHSIGNIFVHGMNDEELETAKKLYKENPSATNKNLAGFIPGKSSLESAPTLAVEDYDDARVCGMALTSSRAHWETRPVFLQSVKEAKRRRLSIEGCRSKLGLAPSTPAPESVIVPAEPPPPDIDAQTLLNDSGFFRSLNKATKRQYKIEIQRLDSVEVKNRSGNQARLILKYLWMNDNDSQRVGRGEATVRSIGGQTEVTDFKSLYPTPSQLLRVDAGASGI